MAQTNPITLILAALAALGLGTACQAAVAPPVPPPTTVISPAPTPPLASAPTPAPTPTPTPPLSTGLAEEDLPRSGRLAPRRSRRRLAEGVLSEGFEHVLAG